ncbi:F0F1 ATP synthase subunit B [Litoribacter ruber]|uniref:ATP synthase subunit b n=1 Tax=Litoribacter ruber TaxID=702568 RepID=A0AAP2G188_9BACT|nr:MULTISPECIES: F0F1 ATP synthase subunit B [Litoribacter]MBS9524209.1 F0F1 ATP synthase subunit B [Litoribacter alkaliphilus]MBT0809993.1 F0F1 ATP synthase subunit B [Litoribacter ruber]
MDLILPESGLIIWQAIGFIILFVLLAKFAWKPILGALEEREQAIESAILAAENARNEMANLKAQNESLLQEARLERDQLLQKASETSARMIEEAKLEAEKAGAEMIANAKAVIETEKKAALAEVKNQVAILSLEVTEKLLRRELKDESSQKALVEEFVSDLKLN